MPSNINITSSIDIREKELREKCKDHVIVPNITVVPERTLVNFITRAESVALAPITDF